MEAQTEPITISRTFLENITVGVLAFGLVDAVMIGFAYTYGGLEDIGMFFNLKTQITIFLVSLSLFTVLFFIRYPRYKAAFNEVSDVLTALGATGVKDAKLSNRIILKEDYTDITVKGTLSGRRIRMNLIKGTNPGIYVELMPNVKTDGTRQRILNRKISIIKWNKDKFISIIPDILNPLFDDPSMIVNLVINRDGNIKYGEGMRSRRETNKSPEAIGHVKQVVSGLEEIAARIESNPDLFKEYF